MLVLMVALQIKSEHRAEYIEAIRENAAASVRDEPGCLRFEVIQDLEDPNQMYLYEVYKDQPALEAHRTMPHFLKYRDRAQEWQREGAVRRLGVNLHPTDVDWR